MPVLAINGGSPVRSTPFPAWPIHDQREFDAVVDVVKSGRWGGHYLAEPGYKADEFAARFAAAHDARCGIAAMNGTVTLKVALRAAGVGPGDEVIVPRPSPGSPPPWRPSTSPPSLSLRTSTR
jgi:dTDP-4-amino-4,6-dideoxygalactose transaminase